MSFQSGGELTGNEMLTGVPYENIKAGRAPISTLDASALPIHSSSLPIKSSALSTTNSSIQAHQSSLHFGAFPPNVITPEVIDSRSQPFSAYPPVTSAREGRTPIASWKELHRSIKTSSSPSTTDRDSPDQSSSIRNSNANSTQASTMAESTPPRILETQLLSSLSKNPVISLADLASPDKIQFSSRGSMLIAGKRATELQAIKIDGERLSGRQTTGTGEAIKQEGSESGIPEAALSISAFSTSAPAPAPAPEPSSNLKQPPLGLSADEELLSLRIRNKYETGMEEGTLSSSKAPLGLDDYCMVNSDGGMEIDQPTSDGLHLAVPLGAESTATSWSNRRRESFIARENQELAGGIEDWQDVNGQDIDRYGFIAPRQSLSNASPGSLPTPTRRLHRATTLLQLASESPRQRHRSSQSPAASSHHGVSTSKMTALKSGSKSTSNGRPVSSQSSIRSSSGTSRLFSATSKVPQRRDKRYLDDAADMLTLPPGLAAISEREEDGRAVGQLKKKETQREEKWRKMARMISGTRNGGGMVFEFDTTNPKLVERTWKGIPDSWRATAWHSFLSASAQRHGEHQSDAALIATFGQLVEQGSPDDVQIDIDVPRTINSHIMFRRRYRGGQRLLFRVLHCVSIYFPATGYVQGMAALAATLLCYFDEEMAFVMLVRMWELRGLGQLYESGFQGLMGALEEFEQCWLKGGKIAQRMNDLGISSTAYGTRWYLTLFNYSIPFPAQLRVWDVFLLLGDASASASMTRNAAAASASASFQGGLDVLHATSAALIDGMRDILLDADFENAMKVLTSWIPVRDEEVLMRVARAEWRLHRSHKGR